jgi:hypothetical protein
MQTVGKQWTEDVKAGGGGALDPALPLHWVFRAHGSIGYPFIRGVRFIAYNKNPDNNSAAPSTQRKEATLHHNTAWWVGGGELCTHRYTGVIGTVLGANTSVAATDTRPLPVARNCSGEGEEGRFAQSRAEVAKAVDSSWSTEAAAASEGMGGQRTGSAHDNVTGWRQREQKPNGNNGGERLLR